MNNLNTFKTTFYFKSLRKNQFFRRASLISAILMIFGMTSAHAVDVQTVDSLLEQDIVLSEAVEYHITNSKNALTNSTVDLTNVDAWLFFDNMRPTEVVAKYRTSIKINGNTLTDGTNGRVAIYKLGTVIMPHGSDFKPLTVYTETEFGGNQSSYAVHTYYTNLGAFDNAIMSFKLKRGYMATFANNNDGSGYSRVFIADNSDLEINMPALLSGKVSFIRVFKHQWVTKKGKAGWNPEDINSTAYYDWNIGGNSSYNYEYAAIRQNGGWPSWDAINNKQNISHLLGFNEPDRPDQSNISMDDMISQWPNFMKSGLRIGSPAWSSEWNSAPGGGNLFDFIAKCDELNYRVDFVALHCYWVKSAQDWYNSLKYIHDRTGRPLWITEWNNGANWTTESWPAGNREYNTANANKQLNDMKAILQVLDTASFVERYFIYDWVQDCRAMVLNGGLTLAGQYYYDNPSEIAFTHKNEVIPHWNTQKPYIKLLTSIPSLKKNLIQWEDPNKELTNIVTVERRINDGEFVEVFSTTNPGVTVYQDPYQEGVQGTVQFRIKCVIAGGTTVYSPVKSVSVTSGQDSIQIAKFMVSNFDDQACVFPQSFTNDPSIILGPISYRNSKPQLTKRISKLDDSKVDMRVETWAFQAGDNLDIQNKPESISFLALPDGNYDMEGITAEVKKVSSVNGSWKQVNFTVPFDTKPIVFVTQLTDVTSFPTKVRIKDVTTTGFQVCIQKEAAQTASVSSETITYFAATEGTGVLDRKKIAVGKTTSMVGDLLKQVQINVDDSYTDPALFAELQTANDNVTTSLRYFDVNLNKRVFKQAEMSTGAKTVAQDELGYMIIDMAAGQFQPVQKLSSQPVAFYPNPAREVLYFKMSSPAKVEIFDLTGSKVLEENIHNQLNIESLNSGIYLVFVNGKATGKFMKM
ncbi:glycosyl hydrolase [Saccharicrinis sp. FJH62]|uniref:glycosyl hydrolase n=1 Tax=Saccharicrinis sp. FJH62 TaxID=3344657 RepID=UPI0035D52931